MKTCPVGVDLFLWEWKDGRTDRLAEGRHDEANSLSSQFCECAKNCSAVLRKKFSSITQQLIFHWTFCLLPKQTHTLI